jgi:hypothetical protein
MHKKVIKNIPYFYTTYRDDSGKIKTKYLGRDPKLARKRERAFKGIPEPCKLTHILPVFLIALFALVFLGTFTAYFVYQPAETISFDLNESWNLSGSFVRISMENFSEDLTLDNLLSNGSILVNLSTISFPSPGSGYVDLIVNSTVVESKQFSVDEDAINETIPETNLTTPANETSESDNLTESVIPEENITQPEENITEEPLEDPKKKESNMTIQAPPEEPVLTSLAAPTHDNPLLNATSASNISSDNLTVYNISTADGDGNTVENIINWYKDDISIAVLNMHFENNGSSEGVKDHSGYDNDVVDSTAPWDALQGHDGRGAYSFDGIDDYVLFADSPSLSLREEISIELWVRFNDSTVSQSIISKYGTGERSYHMGLQGAHCSSGDITWTTSSTTSTFTGGVLCSNPVLTNDNWTHVVVTMDPSTSMKIYINGVDQTDGFAYGSQPSGIADSPMNLSIGAGYSSSTVPNTEFFNGSISELRIYNHSLSEQQVKALYNNQTDMIVSQETEMYEVWQACITPNDGTVNGETKCSNNLTISKCPGELGNWVMNDDYTLEHNITCESILINNSATLTVTNKRTITTKNLTVMADSQINSDEQGYSGGGYRADGEGPGGGDFSSPAAGGGSYGGESGRGGSGGSLRGSKSQPYGSMWRPDDYGSGGAGGYDANRPGGDGGGLIQLEISDIFILNGTISADGGNGTSGSNPGAGGAGGGIYINASTLKGDGRLHADGGGGRNDGDDEDSGGGSGGRIAVYFTEDSFSGMAQSNAHAGLKEGTSGEDGEPGTVVFVDIDDNKLWASSKVEFNGTDFFSAGTFKETAESQFNFSEAHFMTSSMYVSSELNITLDLLNMSAVTSFTCDSYSGTENFGFAINYSSSRIFDISTTVFNVSTISLNPSLSFSSCNRINVFENTSSSAFFDNKSISFDNDLLVSNPEGESINNASIYVTNDMNISNMTLNLKLLISNITVNENLRIPQFESLKMINSSLNREIHTSSLILYVEKNISLFNSTLYGNYRINTTNLTIDSSSKIAADTRGYSGGSSSSDGSGPAGGDSASTYSACGASHGGRGGRGTYNGAYYCVQKDPVGSALAPNDYGSGGAGGNGGVGGDGGGLLWLEVGDTLVLDGSITSHGEDGFCRWRQWPQ